MKRIGRFYHMHKRKRVGKFIPLRRIRNLGCKN